MTWTAAIFASTGWAFALVFALAYFGAVKELQVTRDHWRRALDSWRAALTLLSERPGVHLTDLLDTDKEVRH